VRIAGVAFEHSRRHQHDLASVAFMVDTFDPLARGVKDLIVTKG